jgi:copper chaperone NosL
MVISDRSFAAQVRGDAKAETAKFDDLGCALKWLDSQPFADSPAARVWVARQRDGVFVDARAVRYSSGASTPMGFGFAAVGAEGPLTFADVRAQVRNVGRRRQ